MTTPDIIIRNGTVIDGTGAPARRADVAITDDRITAVEPTIAGKAKREIDAEGRLVTPGFVDIHTHLDAQIAWDPVQTSSCWHGITSAVLGNCGVTFAPVAPGGADFLAEMMESVEDIPRRAILEGLPWDWTTYGEYLNWIDRTAKGINVGGMVGHSAVRLAAMGMRGMDETAGPDDVAKMVELVDEAMSAGALGFSTSRTLLHVVPDGRQVPGTFADAAELLAFAGVLGKHGKGVFEAAARLGERDKEEHLPNTRAEVAWMGEVSRRSGRPVSFGLVHSERRPELFRRVVEFAKEENTSGAMVRPQTTCRGIGVIYTLNNRMPFRSSAWKELMEVAPEARLDAVRSPERWAALAQCELVVPAEKMWILPAGDARYDCKPEDNLEAIATRRGVTPAEAYLDACLEAGGPVNLNYPILNQSFDAVQEMLDDPVITLGLADAGAHVGQIMDSSQPTFFLTYWVREKQRWQLEEAIRRLTSDTADLFGVVDRGRLEPGRFADVNVIDFDNLRLPQPEYVYDFPNGAGRYIQGASGYDYTLVNGQVFMDHGEHTGAFAGTTIRS
ncbi:MAG: amidohydrolase family protein [Actinomycetota bacterium]|nr:amidohydrolase family protein [Actinomycetota bacterium]